jgi:hypothetical protein
MSLLIRVLAFPVVVALGLLKAIRALRSARYAWASSLTCRHCGSSIALVRAWRCSCGFTYVGSVLRQCPVCSARPVMARCDQCGMTRKIR